MLKNDVKGQLLMLSEGAQFFSDLAMYSMSNFSVKLGQSNGLLCNNVCSSYQIALYHLKPC